MRKSADSKELSSRQKHVAVLLASGCTREQAAKRAGVGERTVYLWLRDEAFRGYLKSEESRLRGELVAALRRSVMKAIGVLDQALDSDDEDRRLIAARALLSAGARLLALIEVSDLSERVDRLEQAVAGGTNGQLVAQN